MVRKFFIRKSWRFFSFLLIYPKIDCYIMPFYYRRRVDIREEKAYLWTLIEYDVFIASGRKGQNLMLKNWGCNLYLCSAYESKS